jgi:hypothetical protein
MQEVLYLINTARKFLLWFLLPGREIYFLACPPDGRNFLCKGECGYFLE